MNATMNAKRSKYGFQLCAATNSKEEIKNELEKVWIILPNV